MKATDLHTGVIEPALKLLPAKFALPSAKLQLGATAIQESNLLHRKQQPGPARSLWQFEPIAIEDVRTRLTSQRYAREICDHFGIPFETPVIYAAMQWEKFDIFSCVFARLNYWNHPTSLPRIGDIEGAWNYYIKIWKPGKPHRNRWDQSYYRAHGAIIG